MLNQFYESDTGGHNPVARAFNNGSRGVSMNHYGSVGVHTKTLIKAYWAARSSSIRREG